MTPVFPARSIDAEPRTAVRRAAHGARADETLRIRARLSGSQFNQFVDDPDRLVNCVDAFHQLGYVVHVRVVAHRLEP